MTEINDYLKLLWPRMARAFCPSCGREIRPETAKSIADEVLRGFSGKNVLVTFWVAVPPKTQPRDFFAFLQQQGYLRVWIDNQVVRVDSDAKIKRLGARVQVIQDRIAIDDQNRARLVEAIETALRFGKGKINIVSLPEKENAHRPTSNVSPSRRALRAGGQRSTAEADSQSAIRDPQLEMPFSTGWHCAHCDVDVRPPTPGLFSFNNPLGACPECRGFGRTIAIDLNRAMPDRSLSIKEGVVRAFRGLEFGESQKDLLRACAHEEIDINVPFEELPKADQDFVINGEKRGDHTDDDYEDDRWYGVRGFFRWLESKTYKMHVRVLLSRYRAYTTCPSCKGGRFQPEALNYKLEGRAPSRPENGADGAAPSKSAILFTLPEFTALSISDALNFLAKIDI
jgi:excinuclease ABC subunit A